MNVQNTYNPYPPAHGLWWQVALELSSNRSAVAVWSRHFTPDDTVVCRLVAVGHSCLAVMTVKLSGYITENHS